MLGVTLLALVAMPFAGPPRHDRSDQAFFEIAACNFCVSRDGKRLALDSWMIWDIPGRKLLLKGETSGAWGMAFSPDGKLLAVGGNYAELQLFDTITGNRYWNLTLSHGDTIMQHVEFTPDGRFMVSASVNGMLRVWDVRKKKAHALYCFPSPREYDQNSQDEYLRAWRALAGKDRPPDDVRTFIVFKKKIAWFGQFTLSPDGKMVAVPTRSTEVLLIELATGKIVKTLKTEQKRSFSVRFSPDGKTLAVGGGGDDFSPPWQGTLEMWDVAAGKRLRGWRGHKNTVLKMAFSPDGKILATGGLSDGVRVWETATGKQMYRLHEEAKKDGLLGVRIQNVAFLPDGKALLTLREFCTRDGSYPVCFWEPATGKRIPQPLGK